MDKIKIAIADDEKMIREGLKIILETYEDIEVVALAQNGKEALEAVRNNPVDLVLMDIRMPVMDGVMATKLICQEFSKVKILILTTFTDTEYIKMALEGGALGYLLKDSDYDVIHEGIVASMKGSVVVHPDIASKMLSDLRESACDEKKIMKDYDLTQRDITLMKKIADGKTNKEISEEMYLSEGTVKNLITVILSKLDLRDRNQITVFCYKKKVVN